MTVTTKHVEVYDNFLPEELHLKIKNVVIGPHSNFPWYYNDHKAGNDFSFDHSIKYNFQFTHTLYACDVSRSSFFNIFSPIIELLNPTSLIRAKINLTPCTDDVIAYHYHIDIPPAENTKTAIYYVNTNNGTTLFKNGGYINSIENRLVIFDSKIYHTGTTCTDEKVRCVINLNYIK